MYIIRSYLHFYCFLKVIGFQVFLSNTNNFLKVAWFQVFLSNTNNYMFSINHFYLIIVICFPTVIFFQVGPVGWSTRIHRLNLYRGVRHPHPQRVSCGLGCRICRLNLCSVLVLTLNNLVMRLQQCRK